MNDVYKGHRSHISAGEAASRGWSRIPSSSVRAETLNLNQEVGTSYMAGTYTTLTATYTGANSAGDCTSTIWYPQQTWAGDWQYIDAQNQPSAQIITQIIKEKEVTKEVDKRTLFKVYVVNPKKNGEILLDGKSVIAVNENQAMLKAGLAEIADKAGLDIEQLDVYVQTIGTFIRPRKETQKVKMVKDEEE